MTDDNINERAKTALQAELERVSGNLDAFDPERPMRDLMNQGYSPDESSEALDEGKEALGLWN
jgi:hypothetical protein